MFNNTYGNFAQAREGMKMAMYGAISFLTHFVLNNANAADAHKQDDKLYVFGPSSVVLIPIYNGIIGEIENLRIKAVGVDEKHDLYVKTDEETYYLTDYSTDIIVIGAVWNILEYFYQYFD